MRRCVLSSARMRHAALAHRLSIVAQVRSDCSPQRLLEFLAGEAGLAANEAAEVVASSRAQEDALLEQVPPFISTSCMPEHGIRLAPAGCRSSACAIGPACMHACMHAWGPMLAAMHPASSAVR